MRRLSTLLLTGLMWASLAATAQSQEGSSLYEPFAQPSGISRAEGFVSELQIPGSRKGRLDLSRKQIESGVVVDQRTGALTAAEVPAAGASDRAAGGEGLAPSFGWLLGTALLAAAAASVRLTRIPSRAA